jgi:hypothetical protein
LISHGSEVMPAMHQEGRWSATRHLWRRFFVEGPKSLHIALPLIGLIELAMGWKRFSSRFLQRHWHSAR